VTLQKIDIEYSKLFWAWS